MNTAAIKNAAIAKAKGAPSSSSAPATANGSANASASSNANGASKKRRGGNQLKPIITNESGKAGQKDRETSAASASSNMNK